MDVRKGEMTGWPDLTLALAELKYVLAPQNDQVQAE